MGVSQYRQLLAQTSLVMTDDVRTLTEYRYIDYSKVRNVSKT